ncbi:MAG: type II toxin-antitoxin system RelE/ParE family toxin [Clostridia bacterium]|nr:type II toxin-antitoxin system RelE/ParE family toxin [Clostridia bacterium]
MNFNIKITNEAKLEIEKTFNYLCRYFSKELAIKNIKNLRERIDSLKTNPYLGKDPSQINSIYNYRILITKYNIVFYKIINNEIIVYHIFSQKEDYIEIMLSIID